MPAHVKPTLIRSLRRLAHRCAALVLTLTVVGSGFGQQRASQPPDAAHVDTEGLPLPDEAAARVGSARLRHGAPVVALAFAPDGKTLASLSQQWELCLWDARTGRPLKRYHPHMFSTVTLVYRADGKEILLVDSNDCRRIDPSTGKQLGSFTINKRGFVPSVYFSADRRTLAVLGFGNAVHLFDVATGKQRHHWELKGPQTDSAAFSHDGKWIAASSSRSSLIEVFDLATGKRAFDLDASGGNAKAFEHFTGAGTLAFSPDGKYLLGGAVLWDVAARKVLWRHKKVYQSRCAAFSPDSRLAAYGSVHGRSVVIVAEAASGKELHRLPITNAYCLTFAPDGRTLLAGTHAGEISVWNTTTGRRHALTPEPYPQAYDLAFRGGAKLQLRADAFELWDWKAGKRLTRSSVLSDKDGGVADLSPDSRLLARPGPKGVILLEDTGGRAPRQLAGHAKRCTALRFAPDGRTLWSAGGDNLVRAWDVATGKPLLELKSHGDAPDHLVLSPDGRWLISATRYWFMTKDHDTRLWDARTGRLVRVLAPGVNSHWGYAFSPDGRRLAVAGSLGPLSDYNEPGRVLVFDVEAGTDPLVLGGLERPARAIAFSPDGRCVAAAEVTQWKDHRFRYWELATARERHTFQGHTGTIHALAFAPDGALLAAASSDAPVYLWSIYGAPGKASARKTPWPPDEAWRLWDALASPEAPAGFAAVRQLVREPVAGVALLRERLRPPAPLGRDRLRPLLRDLSGDDFAKRRKAQAELERLGEAAEGPLRAKLAAGGLPLETRRRVAAVLAAGRLTQLRRDRALEALEHIATAEAATLLDALATGPAAAPLTAEARAVRDRLRR